MSKITEELVLKNMEDVTLAQRGLKKEAEIWWKDRSIPMPFIIVPEGATNLFSVTAMELLDLMPDPIQGKLVGVHGDKYVTMLE
ncbi:hypothetical protein AGMMS49579_03290 [Spirochaetia bacterium]|nr:hypothetical protein AGMMS49579_03290 [Spirochaetia bacterium]